MGHRVVPALLRPTWRPDPTGRRVLLEGDVIAFGAARHECEVLSAPCRPTNEVLSSGVVRPLPAGVEAGIRRAG